MIIVNQDKDSIVNFDKVHNLWIDDNNNHKFYETEENDEYNYEILADDETLGYYKTEARAKEVLQEIIDTYSKIYGTRRWTNNNTRRNGYAT